MKIISVIAVYNTIVAAMNHPGQRYGFRPSKSPMIEVVPGWMDKTHCIINIHYPVYNLSRRVNKNSLKDITYDPVTSNE